MRGRLNFISVTLLLSLSLDAFAGIDNLQKGVVKTSENAYELTQTRSDLAYAYGTAWLSHRKKGESIVVSFFVVEGSNELFSISAKNNLYLTNLKDDAILGYWPLARWPALRLIPEILADHREVGASQWKEQIEYTSRKPFAGCMNQNPLRYGDVEDDGASELVLTLNGELIIFSPDYQRTVFSAFYDADDWYRDEMENVSLKSSLVKGESYQHLSEHLLYNGYSHKAHRVYTKLYINDYDQDGNSDVVTWQKVYASNKVDETAGFHLIRNEFRHFKRDLKAQEESDNGITGEYLPQETDEATIRQWLAENELTWRKGYPSTSECEGKGGQLIFEMHDPLLNDPDVLE